jgi:hypothetical protein
MRQPLLPAATLRPLALIDIFAIDAIDIFITPFRRHGHAAIIIAAGQLIRHYAIVDY